MSSPTMNLRPELSELIVLQMIYSLLISKNGSRQKQSMNSSGNSDQMNDSQSSSNNSNSAGFAGSLFRVSLVKLTNEIQNNILINQIMKLQENQGSNKIGINDILKIIGNLFPGHKTSLVDGQISFYNLQLSALRRDLMKRYDEFKSDKIEKINKIEENIKNQRKSISRTPTPTSSASTALNATTANKVIKKEKSKKSMMDPKREKLLQLYRDTVLNKLQGKNKIFDELYEKIHENETLKKIPEDTIKNKIELDQIKNNTPQSVHELQLILQKSICDGLIRFPIGSKEWKLAKQVQTDFDDTVQFMRRALE